MKCGKCRTVDESRREAEGGKGRGGEEELVRRETVLLKTRTHQSGDGGKKTRKSQKNQGFIAIYMLFALSAHQKY